MNKGLTILANYKTNERILVFLNPNENDIQKIVNEKLGGDWIKVGELCLGDMLKFASDDVYLGFDNREDDLRNLEYPIVKAFIIYIQNNVPHAIFNILYEPILMKFTLNKIAQTGAAQIIDIAENVEDLLDILQDLHYKNSSDPILVN